ncbi:MAG: hypothetical protein AAB491_01040, partial [Patescibacteria group bacterium]
MFKILSKHKKSSFLITVAIAIIFAVSFFVNLNDSQAASQSLSGYAWSSNIGWLSFSGANYGVK